MRRDLALAFVLPLVSCSSPHIAHVVLLGIGEPCDGLSACKQPLVCGQTSGVCEPSRAHALGESCVVSLDCATGLYCDAGVCAAAGSVAEGGLCLSTGDCESALRCSPAVLGGECTAAGVGWLDASCATSNDCLAGLVCDPENQVCSQSFLAPAGASCTTDVQCATPAGSSLVWYCDTTAGVCRGRGPDDAPLERWSLNCPGGNVTDGDFRVRFEVGASDFFALPYPNDARIAGGKLVLTGFPTPPASAAPSPFVERWVQAAGDLDGYGPNVSVFMRFSGPPKFCSACAAGDSTCLTTCMGKTEQARSVYVADLTQTGGVFSSQPFTNVLYSWAATTADSQYLCGPSLRLWPAASTPWLAGHTYFVFVHRRVQGKQGTSWVNQAQAPGFAAMLDNTAPADTALAAAWAAYAPVRAWLDASPVYPTNDINEGQAVHPADIGGGALFTIRDPTRPLLALAEAVASGAVPAVHDVVSCSDSSPPADCSDTASEPFTEIHGLVDLVAFQAGTPPFESAGGNVQLDTDGHAIAQGTISVRFSLTVPKGTPVAGTWPIVLYAHGVAGDWRTHVQNGLASTLSAVTYDSASGGFAVLGFDGVAHGERRAGSTWDPERLFFNLENPDAARGNVLQEATDILALRRVLAESASDISGDLDGNHVLFLGEGPGATAGALATAVSSDITAVSFSSLGAAYIDSLLDRSTPWAGRSYLSPALADPSLGAAREHPVLSLIQGALEEADPVNMLAAVALGGLGAGTHKHVLQIIGTGDSYAPSAVALNAARRLLVDFLDDDQTGLLGSSDFLATAPVRGNLGGYTRVASLHAVAAGTDGDQVLVDPTSGALDRLSAFLLTAVTDPEGVPTVP